jgi:hypothetical protein
VESACDGRAAKRNNIVGHAQPMLKDRLSRSQASVMPFPVANLSSSVHNFGQEDVKARAACVASLVLPCRHEPNVATFVWSCAKAPVTGVGGW